MLGHRRADVGSDGVSENKIVGDNFQESQTVVTPCPQCCIISDSDSLAISL